MKRHRWIVLALSAAALAGCASGGEEGARDANPDTLFRPDAAASDGGRPSDAEADRDGGAPPDADPTPADATPGDATPADATPGDAMPGLDATPEDAMPGPTTLHVYVGSAAGSLHHFVLDPATGALTARGTTPGGSNPSFLAFAPDGRAVYAVNESYPGGQVSAFSRDPADGALTFVNRVSSEGSGPAHLSVEPGGRFVLVSNYGDGRIASLPIQAGGGLGRAASALRAGDNAHLIVADAAGRHVFVPCLGDDLVAQYDFDGTTGALTPNAVPSVASTRGAGPRHLAFHPSERWAYVINEHASSITQLDYASATGQLTARGTVSTLPTGFAGSNTCAEVVVHPSGRFVYGSNRGHDSIARFAVDAQTGALTALGHTPTGGDTPRSFGLTPDGSTLLVANQDSGDVRAFRVDAASGELTALGGAVPVPRPTFVGVIAD